MILEVAISSSRRISSLALIRGIWSRSVNDTVQVRVAVSACLQYVYAGTSSINTRRPWFMLVGVLGFQKLKRIQGAPINNNSLGKIHYLS